MNLNFVMVIGACGDYLGVADTVIVMEDWEPRLATLEAAAICGPRPMINSQGWPKWPLRWDHSLEQVRKQLTPGLRPASAVEKGIKVKANLQRVQLGRLQSDVSRLSQFVCIEQIRSVGAAALSILKSDMTGSLEDAVSLGSASRSFPEGMDLAQARSQELGAMLLRMAEME
jgi:predicted ABC-class ATPase